MLKENSVLASCRLTLVTVNADAGQAQYCLHKLFVAIV
jgi:hypothetical protein